MSLMGEQDGRILTTYERLPEGIIKAECYACGEFLPVNWMELDGHFLCETCRAEFVNIIHAEALTCERCAFCGHTLGEHYSHYNNFCESEHSTGELLLTWRGKEREIKMCECTNFTYQEK